MKFYDEEPEECAVCASEAKMAYHTDVWCSQIQRAGWICDECGEFHPDEAHDAMRQRAVEMGIDQLMHNGAVDVTTRREAWNDYVSSEIEADLLPARAEEWGLPDDMEEA